jgi:hypothetical protein
MAYLPWHLAAQLSAQRAVGMAEVEREEEEWVPAAVA